MALSPFYGWSEPDNSSLVKNGAADIRTLGDAIDTSVWNVGFGQAGKNKLINGDFRVNQRAFTTTSNNLDFGFDRFQLRTGGIGGTTTWTPQVFTPGTAPVAGYEGTNYSRIVTSAFTGTDTIVGIRQNIEDVRTFAGQPVTVSFWAKANTGTPNIGVQISQVPVGSAVVSKSLGLSAITTSWARYSFTTTLGSLTGATISASNYLQVAIYVAVGTGVAGYGTTVPAVTVQNNTFEIWGVQAEYGSKMTPFQTATGTIQGELAACCYYYERLVADAVYTTFGSGYYTTSSRLLANVNYARKRVVPSLALSNVGGWYGAGSLGAATISATYIGKTSALIDASISGASTTVGFGGALAGNNNSAAYIELSSEL
jgi:hypothetical protein